MSYTYQWGGMPPEHASASEVAEGTGMGVSGPGFFGDIANNTSNTKGIIQGEVGNLAAQGASKVGSLIAQGVKSGVGALVGLL